MIPGDIRPLLQKTASHPEVTVRVNLNSSLCVNGPPEALVREIDAVAELAARSANPLLLGTGALPYETPPENALFIIDCASKAPHGAGQQTP